jgi:hypothetical protein
MLFIPTTALLIKSLSDIYKPLFNYQNIASFLIKSTSLILSVLYSFSLLERLRFKSKREMQERAVTGHTLEYKTV